MTTHPLTDRQKTILINVLKDHDTPLWIAKIESESLGHDRIERLCNLLSGEFHMNGIDENFEPNSHGVEVEALLDVVNRPRLR